MLSVAWTRRWLNALPQARELTQEDYDLLLGLDAGSAAGRGPPLAQYVAILERQRARPGCVSPVGVRVCDGWACGACGGRSVALGPASVWVWSVSTRFVFLPGLAWPCLGSPGLAQPATFCPSALEMYSHLM